MTNKFDALLTANDISSMGRDVMNNAVAEQLDGHNVWFPASFLRGSLDNPLAVLQALIVDPIRECSLDGAEFERITGLDPDVMFADNLDHLTDDQVLKAIGELTLCWLVAARNTVRCEILEPAGLHSEREEATGASFQWAQARAERRAAQAGAYPSRAARRGSQHESRTLAGVEYSRS